MRRRKNFTLSEIGIAKYFKNNSIKNAVHLSLITEQTLNSAFYLSEEEQKVIKRALKRNHISFLQPTGENISLDSSIEELLLSQRIINILVRNSIFTINDLCKCTKEYLLSFDNFGDTGLNEIEEKLYKNGLKLKDVTSLKVTPQTKIHPLYIPSNSAILHLGMYGYTTIGDVCLLSENTLIKVMPFKKSTIDYLKIVLQNSGLHLFNFSSGTIVSKNSSIEALNLSLKIIKKLIYMHIKTIEDLKTADLKSNAYISFSQDERNAIAKKLNTLFII